MTFFGNNFVQNYKKKSAATNKNPWRRCGWLDPAESVFAVGFAHGVAGEVNAEFLEYLAVDFREHHGGVYLTSAKLRELRQSEAAVFIGLGHDGKGHEHFVGMQAGVVASEVLHFRGLDRLDHCLRDELHAVVNARKVLDGIEDKGGAGPEEVGGFGCDDGTVGELDCRAVVAATVAAFAGGHGDAAVVGGDFCLVEQELYFLNLSVVVRAVREFVCGGVVAADDFVV